MPFERTDGPEGMVYRSGVTPDPPEQYVIWRAVFGGSNAIGRMFRYELVGTPYNGIIRLSPQHQPVPILDISIRDAEDLIAKLTACVAFMREQAKEE